jgi:hypothetical protein
MEIYLGAKRHRKEWEQLRVARARSKLGYERAQAAVRRGAAMSLSPARTVCAAAGRRGPRHAADPAGAEPGLPGPGGSTNAQIAIQLYISVRTVGSHLDRIGIRPAACAALT